jgi:hypothetical protein
LIAGAICQSGFGVDSSADLKLVQKNSRNSNSENIHQKKTKSPIMRTIVRQPSGKAYEILGCSPTEIERNKALVRLGISEEEFDRVCEGARRFGERS